MKLISRPVPSALRYSWSLALALAISACTGGETRCENDVGNQLRPLAEHAFVAHAGGSPHGLLQTVPYSNSRDAFEMSYANGFRVYEFDLLVLADGEIIVAHDYHEEHFGLIEGTFPELTRPELEGRLYDDQFEVMFAEDLIQLMVDHPDIWVILDTKWDHEYVAQQLVAMSPGPEVTDRLVPHLGSHEQTQALQAIYPFPEQMIAVYRWRAEEDAEILERQQQYGVDNVMMWWNWRWSEETQVALEAAGMNVWVHTPHEPELIESFLDRGVGVYTDGYISPCD